VIATYRREREAGERFLQTVRRIGLDAFKQATNGIRRTTAKQTTD
jgi:sulfite reductase (NADPH) hemoprotein beta-component